MGKGAWEAPWDGVGGSLLPGTVDPVLGQQTPVADTAGRCTQLTPAEAPHAQPTPLEAPHAQLTPIGCYTHTAHTHRASAHTIHTCRRLHTHNPYLRGALVAQPGGEESPGQVQEEDAIQRTRPASWTTVSPEGAWEELSIPGEAVKMAGCISGTAPF